MLERLVVEYREHQELTARPRSPTEAALPKRYHSG
jgi:hypothetical protein